MKIAFKIVFLSFILVAGALKVEAQSLGYEWVDPNQDYYKIMVSGEGVYRLTYQQLQDAGFPVNTIDPRRLRLIFRGAEQAIWIEGEADGRWSPGDYLEFYGVANDATLDAEMYDDPDNIPSPERNLYSDQTAYFLTYRRDGSFGLRMEFFYESNTSEATVPYFEAEAQLLAGGMAFGGVYPSYLKWKQYGAEISTLTAATGWLDFSVGTSVQDRFVEVDLGAAYLPVAGKQPQLSWHAAGRTHGKHLLEIGAGPDADRTRVIRRLEFDGIKAFNIDQALEPSDIDAGASSMTLRINNQDADPSIDQEVVSMGSISLSFTQGPNLEGATQRSLMLPIDVDNRSRVVMENPAGGTRIFDITNPNQPRIIGSDLINGRLNALIDGTQQQRRLLFSSEQRSVDFVKAVEFSPLPTNIDYLIVTHQGLRQAAGEYDDPVQAYADYRSSSAGGSFNVYVANAGQLYDYFTYGEYSPLAIRRFIRYLLSRGNDVKHVFLVGKALNINGFYYRNIPQDGSVAPAVVPCMGTPCSDVLFTSRLNGESDDVGSIPIGRLSARNATHVANYLNKVKEHEQFVYDNFDKKKVLFLSGGISNLERVLIRIYSEEFERIVEDKYLGAVAEIQGKKTTDAVELLDVSSEVNSGLQILSVFGHAGPTFTDIDIGAPGAGGFNYQNKGSYPMLMINGCRAGDIYINGTSKGEQWLNVADAGAIAFIANSGAGFPSTLRRHARAFFNNVYGDSTGINLSVGEALLKANREFIDQSPDNPVAIAQLQQYILQGDPAIKLFKPTKPDYEVTDGSMQIENTVSGDPISADMESFFIKVPVKNFGVVSTRPIKVAVQRFFNNGANGNKWYPVQEFSPILSQDTLLYRVENTPEDREKSSGIDRFEVYVDYGNEVEEGNEANNKASFEFIFPKSAIRLLFPTDFSIVNQRGVRLIAQNLDMLPSERDYQFQLDLTDEFNSGALREQLVTATFNPTWEIGQLPQSNADTVTYYWRVRFANVADGEEADWIKGSFTYINNGPKGWTQRDYPQFKDAQTTNMASVVNGGKWEFITDSLSISLKTVGSRRSKAEGFIKYNEIDLLRENGNCPNNMLLLLVIDHKTGEVRNNIANLNFFVQCGYNGTPLPIIPFGRVRFAQQPFLDYIAKNSIDSGDYVIMMNSGSIPFSFMQEADYEVLERMGIPQNTFGEVVQEGYPFIAMGRLDVPGYEASIFTADLNDTIPANEQELVHTFQVPITRNGGIVLSPPIGPAQSWKDLQFDIGSADAPNEQALIDLIGVSEAGNEQLLQSEVSADGIDLSDYSTDVYPYMRLRARFSDPSRTTPQQLERWQVNYDALPEGILKYDRATADFSEPLSYGEGEEASFYYRFENLTEIGFEQKIVFQRTLQRADNSISVQFDTLTALPGLESMEYEVKVATLGLSGENTLTVFANPISQRERHYDNNVLQRRFQVNPDRTNPVLDVAFDGVRIMDGDIVSPRPTVNISLTDENPYYTLADTATIQLFLSGIDAEEMVEIPTVGNPDIEWIEQGENALRINYSPQEPLQDGRYKLRVQAKDATGNDSGTQPYEVSFEVINASQITHFYPYPNPFSTNVRFVFTLTGDRIPDELRIQIMTVSGRVVREIAQDELGPIKVGNNISQFAWDGTDSYGDKLANGTYLYRVIANYGGEEIERRQTANDNLFKNNIGKMYLIR